MANMSTAKMLSPAGVDLGLGLTDDLEDEEERKKRLLQQQNSPGKYGDTVTSPMAGAAMMLGLGNG